MFRLLLLLPDADDNTDKLFVTQSATKNRTNLHTSGPSFAFSYNYLTFCLWYALSFPSNKDLIKNDAGNEFSFVLIKIILESTSIPMQPTKAVF